MIKLSGIDFSVPFYTNLDFVISFFIFKMFGFEKLGF